MPAARRRKVAAAITQDQIEDMRQAIQKAADDAALALHQQDAHEDLCAERYEGIKTVFGEVKQSLASVNNKWNSLMVGAFLSAVGIISALIVVIARLYQIPA